MVSTTHTAPGRIEQSRWHPEQSRRINRRVVITGQLVLETPASLSNGEVIGTEMVILQDAVDNRAILQGSSLAGALRHAMLERELGYRIADPSSQTEKTYATQLFGEALDKKTERMESRVIVNDALGTGNVTRREGVKIDGTTRTADEGMLFATQVWEAGTTFDLQLELVLYEEDPDNYISALSAVLIDLANGRIPMGGRKSRGYGRVRVDDWHVCFYELRQPQALSAWLTNTMHADHTYDFFALGESFIDNRQIVRVDAHFALCDSVLIRAESDVADNEHLTSNNKPTISGTSVAGALRARALKIAQTIGTTESAVRLINSLFGRHGADGETDQLSASRMLVEEHPIERGSYDTIQNRVKIDRFTGGAFDTALFDERPVFATDDTVIRLGFELHYPADLNKQQELDAQTGLLLLLLKDLWTEDLVIGGESSVGRGRLRGLEARMYFNLHKDDGFDCPLWVNFDQAGLSDTAFAGYLQTYVDILWNQLENPL